jgi:hypothetical protein
MTGCDDCELRGYSRELCMMHIRHCKQHPDAKPAPASVRIGARAAGAMALGSTAGLLVATAASFVGGPTLFHSLMVALVAAGGLVGGGWGLARGVAELKPPEPPPQPARRATTRGSIFRRPRRAHENESRTKSRPALRRA